jgi:hypothetical protein
MPIEMLSMPEASVDAGLFNLPPTFDSKKFAAEWVEESSIEMKKLRQPLPQVGATADGWEIWKGEKGKPHTVKTGGNKTFVLMCRPRVIQDQVNALYGNVSKKFINREIKGETVAGASKQDPGILTEDRLRQNEGGASLADESTMPLNRVPIEEPSAATET